MMCTLFLHCEDLGLFIELVYCIGALLWWPKRLKGRKMLQHNYNNKIYLYLKLFFVAGGQAF